MGSEVLFFERPQPAVKPARGARDVRLLGVAGRRVRMIAARRSGLLVSAGAERKSRNSEDGDGDVFHRFLPTSSRLVFDAVVCRCRFRREKAGTNQAPRRLASIPTTNPHPIAVATPSVARPPGCEPRRFSGISKISGSDSRAGAGAAFGMEAAEATGAGGEVGAVRCVGAASAAARFGGGCSPHAAAYTFVNSAPKKRMADA